ncbi:kinase-like domain-containing protein [Nemania sp. NC0429]|nr:kinase-like domain-containing protein [Nemania sp. NC0429]
MDSNRTEVFSRKVQQLRNDWAHARQSSNLFPPAGKPILDMQNECGDKPCMILWYEDGKDTEQCVRLYDKPGTLSGDILRMRRNLPDVNGHFEIDGDTIRPLDQCLETPEPIKDDFENIDDLLESLPLLDIDQAKHFVKKGKYRSEIENLLKCQGGSCPGKPKTHHLIRLLGKSQKGELAFEKLLPCQFVIQKFSALDDFKRWILDMIDGLGCLHLLGIVHRDIRIDNCLFSNGGRRLVLCDLESRWGQRSPPEIAGQGMLDNAGWSTKSDIYCIGECVKCMVYGNAPPTNYVDWPVPTPLDAIVAACMHKSPEERPSLDELRGMVENITTGTNDEDKD